MMRRVVSRSRIRSLLKVVRREHAVGAHSWQFYAERAGI